MRRFSRFGASSETWFVNLLKSCLLRALTVRRVSGLLSPQRVDAGRQLTAASAMVLGPVEGHATEAAIREALTYFRGTVLWNLHRPATSCYHACQRVAAWLTGRKSGP